MLLFSSNNFEHNYIYIFLTIPPTCTTAQPKPNSSLVICLSLFRKLYEPTSKTHHQASATNTTHEINLHFHPSSIFPHLRCFGMIRRHPIFPCWRKSRRGNTWTWEAVSFVGHRHVCVHGWPVCCCRPQALHTSEAKYQERNIYQTTQLNQALLCHRQIWTQNRTKMK